MKELGSLVEEGRLVLVPLDDEGAIRPLRAETVRRVEVLQHAPDQERRIPARLEQHARDDGGGGRLPVRAGHHHRVARRQEEPPDRLRHAEVLDAALQQRRHLGVVAVGDVADDDQVGTAARLAAGGGDVLGPVPFQDRDAARTQQRGNGGIDVLVGAAHPVPGVRQQPRQRAHAGAAHANHVDEHQDLEAVFAPT
jgi:hypothetical protein